VIKVWCAQSTLDLWGERSLDSKLTAYKRELPHARAVDRCVNLVRQWGRQEPEWDALPEAARNFVDEWFEIAGPNRAPRIGGYIDHMAAQWRWDGRRKLNQLRKYRDDMKRDALHVPKLRPVRINRGDRDRSAILSLMRGAPTRHWTISQLAHRLRQTVAVIHALTPHTLRHTCATWMAQRGVPIHEICGFLGMTRETFERVYGHHHPDYQANAVNAFSKRLGQLPDSFGQTEREQRISNVVGLHRNR
jgi:hypothetical protein